MSTTAEKILSLAESLPEGTTFCAKELLHLGGRSAVDQALSRLVKRGKLLRVGHGVYARPVKTRFGSRPPAPESVVKAISQRTGETITTTGAAAANTLGLTTQNPVKAIYLTSGRSRNLRFGQQTVALRHAPAWQLRAPASRAGDALRALAWLGSDTAKGRVEALKTRLTKEEQAELAALRRQTPSWLAHELSGLAAHD